MCLNSCELLIEPGDGMLFEFEVKSRWKPFSSERFVSYFQVKDGLDLTPDLTKRPESWTDGNWTSLELLVTPKVLLGCRTTREIS